MSMMSTYQHKVGKLTADIALLRKKLGQERDREARKQTELTGATRSITKTKSSSTRKMNENKADRLRGEIAKTKKNAADLEKKIATKTKELHSATQRLTKEQDKQNKSRRTDELRHQRTLTREVKERHHLETVQRTLASEFPDYREPAEGARYDIFISHAGQDKATFVEPLAKLLSEIGFEVWYDDFVLKVGDSLRRSIDRGIANSEYGLVVLSPHFFAKGWTEHELDGLTAREVAGRRKLILPIWHNVRYEDVLEYSPALADKLALDTDRMNLAEIAEALAEVLPGVRDDVHSEARDSLSSSHPTFGETTTPETLAQEQGVAIAAFDDLLGDFWPEEEGPEELASALREWREDDSRSAP